MSGSAALGLQQCNPNMELQPSPIAVVWNILYRMLGCSFILGQMFAVWCKIIHTLNNGKSNICKENRLNWSSKRSKEKVTLCWRDNKHLHTMVIYVFLWNIHSVIINLSIVIVANVLQLSIWHCHGLNVHSV